MANKSSSLFGRSVDPLLQAAIVLGLVFLIVAGGKLVTLTGIYEFDQLFPWTTATAFMLFFAMFNAVLSLSSDDSNKYWGRSMMGFIGLALFSGLLAYLFSSVPIGEARSYKWIYFVLTFGYLVFLSMVSFMRKVVEFAEKEEWNQPRPRKRKRK